MVYKERLDKRKFDETRKIEAIIIQKKTSKV